MLRAVLVGCGAMSKTNIEAALATGEVEFVGLVDLDRDRAVARAAEFGLSDVEIGTDLSAILASTAPDFVLDVVVPQARFDVVLTAFSHGCHVLTEKPMADSMEDARGIMAAAVSAGRIHAVVQNRRYLEGVRRIRRFIDSGAIGGVTSHPLRLLRRPAFRRLPRGDGARAAARHGDPHLRRRPLHGRQHAARRLLPRMEPGELLVRAGLLGGRDLRVRPATSSSPIAAPGAPTAAHELGERLAHRRRPRDAPLGRRTTASAPKRSPASGDGLFSETRTRRRAAARSARPHRRTPGRHRRTSSSEPSRRARAGDRRHRQHQEPRHGVRRHRERRDRPARRDPRLSDRPRQERSNEQCPASTSASAR